MRTHAPRRTFAAGLTRAATLVAALTTLAFVSTAAVSSSTAAAAAGGLVAAYSFDAGSGTTVADVSGSGNTGTINGATWTTAGRNGGALSFDGANDWVTVNGSSSLQLTGGMTVEAWVRPTSLASGWRTVVVKERPGFLDYALYAHEGGPGPAGHVNVGGRDRYAPAPAIAANTWTHLAATYDGASLRTYVNGALSTTLASSGAISTSTNPLRIGGNRVWSEWFAGQIDDLRIYNRPLSAAEVQADMTTPVAAPSGDTQAPSAPSGLTTSAVSQTSITLSWSASNDNVGVAGYGHYRNGTLLSNAAGTSFAYTGLACGTTYALGVDAYDAAGNRSAPTQVSATTTACATQDTQPPSVPQGLRITGSTQTTIGMAWNASNDNVGVTGYRLYRNNVALTTTQQLSYTYTGLQCGTTYSLSIEAYDAAGNASYRPQAVASASTSACSGDSQAPTAPTGLTRTGSTDTSISVSWTASTDNVGVTGYGSYVGSSLVGSGTGTTYTFNGLACNTAYTLAVDAYDSAGNRSGRASITASTAACPPAGSANVFMSPSGADANPCTQAQPCRTFSRAYRVATPGAIVQVAGGSYSGETINVDSAKTSPNDVVFRPAQGAAVTVTGQITVSGAHMEFRDMTINQMNFNPSSDDITVRNVVNHGMWWQGSSNISIVGGEITCATCDFHSHMQNGGSPLKAPTNILFDGVFFHDWQSQAGEHVECLQILGADNVTIRKSTFKNCGTANGGRGATASLHLQAYGNGPLPKNILLENNFFYPSGNMYTLQGEDFENFDMRYNSLSGPLLLYNGPSAGTGMDFVGNVLRSSPCTAQNNAAPINWRYNVIQGGTCGPTDRNASSGFVDPNNNLHLAAGAAARNAGDPASYPGADIDGQTRPLGGAPDAGADEAG